MAKNRVNRLTRRLNSRKRSNSSKLLKKRSKKHINVNKLLRELRKLNAQTNILRSNINRNSRKISNIIKKLTKKR